jgi:hypothetical protein
MLLSHHQNVGQNRDIDIANRLFENVSQFKYLGTPITNQNFIQEEIKRRLIELLSKHLKIRIYKTTVLPVGLYRRETWSLTLSEERKQRVFGNRVLRRIFGLKRDEVSREWRKLHNKELHDLYFSQSIYN